MSEYLFCITRPENRDLIEICSSKDDPRQETLEAKLRRRAMGRFKLEWTLLVVDRELSEAALLKAIRPHRAGKSDDGNQLFSCDPMTARGEAIRLTTLRSNAVRKKPSLLRRLIRAA